MKERKEKTNQQTNKKQPHKQLERDPMFLGRKNQYCENDYTTKCNLQIQCNPYQITNGVFHRTRTLCIMGSSFMHLIRTDSNEFFLMAE